MLMLDRLGNLKATLKILFLFFCEDIFVVNLVFTGVNFLGRKCLGVVYLGVILLVVFSGGNYPGEILLLISHYKYNTEPVENLSLIWLC